MNGPDIARQLVLTITAVAALALAACGEDEADPVAPAPTPTAVVTTPPATAISPSRAPISPSGAIRTSALPEQVAKTKLFEEIRGVDPNLVATENEAWDKAEEVCGAVEEQPTDQGGLVSETIRQFGKPADPSGITSDEAVDLLDAIRTHACPGQ